MWLLPTLPLLAAANRLSRDLVERSVFWPVLKLLGVKPCNLSLFSEVPFFKTA